MVNPGIAWRWRGHGFHHLGPWIYVLIGCIQALKCNKTRAGITTHDPQFQKKEPLVPDGAAAYMRASSKKLEPVGDE
jgi:glutamate synthase domain-containing protein 2